MADRKITDLTALAAGSQATGDLLTIVDVSEGAAADKNKKITVESLFKGIPGDIGIGTASPLAKCHIARGSDDNSILYITGADTSSEAVALGVGAGYGMLTAAGSGSTSTDLIFRTANSGTEAERMRIDSSGNVGIGTSSPTQKLSINGNLQFEANDGVTIGAKESLILNLNSSGGQSSRVLQISDNGTARVTFQQAGNVGIGTSSPSTKLSVSGGISGTGGANISGSGWGVLPYVANSFVADSTSGQTRLFATGTDASTHGNFLFFTGTTNGTASERMRIDTGGNLGLGTTSPSTRLEVVGNTTPQLKVGMANDADRASLMHNGSDLYLGTTAGSLIFRTASNTERMRIQSAGGISFNGDTAAANALDDYEEGTWTPSFSPSSGTITSAGTPSGRYTKIGRLVTVHFIITITDAGTAVNTYLYFANLPFTVSNTHNQIGVCREQSINGFLNTAQVTGNATTGAILRYDNAGVIVSGGNYQCTITYETQ